MSPSIFEQAVVRLEQFTGLADDEVRHWRGWYHHQTLSLIAA